MIVQEYLKNIGVEAKLEPLDWPTFVQEALRLRLRGASWSAGPTHHDPDPFAFTIWHSSQWKGRNFAHYKNPRADEALEAARRTGRARPSGRRPTPSSPAILMEDAPYVFLYFPQQVYVTRQGYEGFVPDPDLRRHLPVAAERALAGEVRVTGEVAGRRSRRRGADSRGSTAPRSTWRSWGTGRRASVLPAGRAPTRPGSRARWGRWPAPLGLRMVFWDHRGHGRSEWVPVEQCTQDQLVADMEGVRLSARTSGRATCWASAGAGSWA